MKVKSFIATLFLFLLMCVSQVNTQTLYNGVGHIPYAYKESWEVAGLLEDISTVTPVMCICCYRYDRG